MIKKILKKVIPSGLWRFAKQVLYFNKTRDSIDLAYSGKTVSDIFKDIYVNNEWAKGNEGKFKGKDDKFYSGSGSYNNAAEEYIKFIDQFVKQNNITSITDIGCGDFHIGKQILDLNPTVTYAGVDVVEPLIKHHNKVYSSKTTAFYCIDTFTQPVPLNDLLLVRQVLQHLSNTDIDRLTKNCFAGFKNILVTEHQLKPELLIKKNIDKETGPNIRPAFGSGVYLNSHPFNYKWSPKLTVEDLENRNCEIVTYLLHNAT